MNEAIVVLEGLSDSCCNILLLKLNPLFLLPPVFVTCLSRSELCSFSLNPPRAPNLHLIKPLLNRTHTNPEVTLFLPRRGGRWTRLNVRFSTPKSGPNSGPSHQRRPASHYGGACVARLVNRLRYRCVGVPRYLPCSFTLFIYSPLRLKRKHNKEQSETKLKKTKGKERGTCHYWFLFLLRHNTLTTLIK